MKIAYITTDWSTSEYRKKTGEYGGVGYYRAIKPAEYLKKIGHDVQVFGKDFADNIEMGNENKLFDAYKKFMKQFDVVIIKHIDSANAPRLIGACKDLEIPIIMDIDDNFMVVPESNPAYKKDYDPQGTKRAYSLAAMSMCDAVIVSTQPLKDYFEKCLKAQYDVDMDIYVLPNCCDPKEWTIYVEEKKGVTIGWHGSVTHDEDLKVALPAIRDVLKERKDVSLELVGGLRPESEEGLFEAWGEELKRVTSVQGVPSWKGFPNLIAERNWDIGIAPLEQNEFNRGKSHIKWMEYSLIGVPCIATNIYPYSSNIENGKTGYLVSSRKEWKEKLLRLIDDEDKRAEIAENALRKMGELTYENNIHLWDTVLKKVRGGE